MTYRKITSSNMSRLQAHAGFFRLLTVTFGQKFDFLISTRDSTVIVALAVAQEAKQSKLWLKINNKDRNQDCNNHKSWNKQVSKMVSKK